MIIRSKTTTPRELSVCPKIIDIERARKKTLPSTADAAQSHVRNAGPGLRHLRNGKRARARPLHVRRDSRALRRVTYGTGRGWGCRAGPGGVTAPKTLASYNRWCKPAGLVERSSVKSSSRFLKRNFFPLKTLKSKRRVACPVAYRAQCSDKRCARLYGPFSMTESWTMPIYLMLTIELPYLITIL